MSLFKYPPHVMAYLDLNAKATEPADRLDRFEALLLEHFEALLPFVEARGLKSILDIGCGLGGMDVLLANKLGFEDIHLMDGDGSGIKLSGYKLDTKAWASVDAGFAFVTANVPTSMRVTGHHANPSLRVGVDLVFSSRSWGHHYPIGTYLKLAKRALKPGGLLVTDIRTNTDGADVLKNAGFRRVGRVPDQSLKCQRLVFERGDGW